MSEVANDELMLFNILEELYQLNQKEWKKSIMRVLLKEKEVSYRKIKEKFLKVPDMLVYRCLREMIVEGLILRENGSGVVRYCFTREGKTLAPILAEVEV